MASRAAATRSSKDKGAAAAEADERQESVAAVDADAAAAPSAAAAAASAVIPDELDDMMDERTPEPARATATAASTRPRRAAATKASSRLHEQLATDEAPLQLVSNREAEEKAAVKGAQVASKAEPVESGVATRSKRKGAPAAAAAASAASSSSSAKPTKATVAAATPALRSRKRKVIKEDSDEEDEEEEEEEASGSEQEEDEEEAEEPEEEEEEDEEEQEEESSDEEEDERKISKIQQAGAAAASSSSSSSFSSKKKAKGKAAAREGSPTLMEVLDAIRTDEFMPIQVLFFSAVLRLSEERIANCVNLQSEMDGATFLQIFFRARVVPRRNTPALASEGRQRRLLNAIGWQARFALVDEKGRDLAATIADKKTYKITEKKLNPWNGWPYYQHHHWDDDFYFHHHGGGGGGGGAGGGGAGAAAAPKKKKAKKAPEMVEVTRNRGRDFTRRLEELMAAQKDKHKKTKDGLIASDSDDSDDDESYRPELEGNGYHSKRARTAAAAARKAKTKKQRGKGYRVGAPPTIMEILDASRSDISAQVGVFAAVLTLPEERIAELINLQSKDDGNTFLQIFYRARVLAVRNATLMTEGGRLARLMRVIKSDADLTLTNQQQQTLLHTLVDPETYRLKLADRHYWASERYKRRKFTIIEAEEGDKKECYVEGNNAKALTLRLLQMCGKAKLSFKTPDENGLIPALQLGAMCSKSLLDVYAFVSLIKKTPKRPYLDLCVADASGNSALHVYFKSATAARHEHPGAEMLRALIDKPHLLQRVDLLGANDAGETVIALAAEHCCRSATVPPTIPSGALESKQGQVAVEIMQAWQKGRKDVVSSAFEVWMIPDLADICSEYLLGAPLDGSQTVSLSEKERIFRTGEARSKLVEAKEAAKAKAAADAAVAAEAAAARYGLQHAVEPELESDDDDDDVVLKDPTAALHDSGSEDSEEEKEAAPRMHMPLPAAAAPLHAPVEVDAPEAMELDD